MTIDETHDPARRCWVPGADGHPDFPIQNLPLGIFAPPAGAPRPGVAIGDQILDLVGSGLVAPAATLNGLLSQGSKPRRSLSKMLTEGDPAETLLRANLFHSGDCTLHLPCTVGDYTDFFVGIHHAMNTGKVFRPENPLLPNYRHVPVAYHGRGSSIRASGEPVRRPNGQSKPPDSPGPVFGPCQRLDYELELGAWIGPGNTLGEPIAIGDARDHIAGYCLLNDWSARDIQSWEYQPLGPFLGKNFSTTISCWIVTPEALAPFRTAQAARPAGDPRPLPYLLDPTDQAHGALNLDLEVCLRTSAMRASEEAPTPICRSNARHMYWSAAQMVAHHTSGGCNLRAGDILGTGTLSGTDETSMGSLLEATYGGQRPLRLPNGEQRVFLLDGDEVILTARAKRQGFNSIGFGSCHGIILPATSVRGTLPIDQG
jgi:fumarylacetoacetase